MDNKTFDYTFTVLESHLDTFGHVNNATYLTLFEQARWDLIHNRGYGVQKIQESKLGPTILEINIKYRREVRLRENITIKTSVSDVNEKFCTINQVMVNEFDKVCAEFKMLCGLFDLRQRKLVAATPEWLYAIGAENSSKTAPQD